MRLTGRRLAVALMVLGAALLATGAVGLALTPASRQEVGSPSPSPEPTGSPTAEPTEEPAEEPTEEPAETPEAFVASFNRAQEEEDVRFLLSRLHPEVIQRYGRAQCREYLGEVAGTVGDVEIIRASGPRQAEYATDDQMVTIENARVLRISLTANDEPTTGRMTLAVVGDELRWFTDCGDPV
jgi:hypothetical protein